jgi:putative pyoverdin transport system ATP-binding/permease protein
MNLIRLLVKSSWISLVIAIVAGSISGVGSASSIALASQAIQLGASQQLVWAFIGLAITVAFTNVVSQFVLAELSFNSVYQLRLYLSKRILACPLPQLETLGANKILATLSEDTRTIGQVVSVIPFICIDLAVVVGSLGYLLWLSPISFIMTVIVLGVAVALIQRLLNHVSHLWERAREEEDVLFKHFRTITDGIKELKLNTQRRRVFLNQELDPTAQANRRDNIRAMKMIGVASGTAELLKFAILGLTVFIIPKVIEVDAATLSTFVLVLIYLIQPIQDLLQMVPNLTLGGIALAKIDALGLSLADRPEQVDLSAKTPDFQKLELLQAKYTYHRKQGEEFALGPIDFSLDAGEVVFLIGGNGSGKSTFAKLITGLYEPEGGCIRLNGTVVTEDNRETYRQLFSTVFADFYLFERLLEDRPTIVDTQALHYLEKLKMNHKVQVQSGKLSTVELSQGQRKRLALLNAYLEDRPIYLFDEWAADQDPFFREIFYKQLLPELKHRGKTVLAISHDDRYFHLADRLIKLDYGQLV